MGKSRFLGSRIAQQVGGPSVLYAAGLKVPQRRLYAAMASGRHHFGQGHVLPIGIGHEPRAQRMRREIPSEARVLGPAFQGSPQAAREALLSVQSGPVELPRVSMEDRVLPVGPSGRTRIRVFRPEDVDGTLPVILYYHGAAWVMGDTKTHGVGGNMVAVVSLLAKERHGPALKAQLLFYPVTDASMSDGSYQAFANGPWLTKPAMEWFWNAYLPDVARRAAHVSPLNATPEQLPVLYGQSQ